MEQQPLLTEDQLIDWLIYHRPIEEGGDEDLPFIVEYRPEKPMLGWSFRSFGMDPLHAYKQMATEIIKYPTIHREITDLYWYWTIEPADSW